ncbi:ADP-ribosylation factor-related protein 1 isoform X3 [Leptonychotes weddellii]|uniref:ADP-ribosylation factor-related protein 1 isoform X3 n=1 Tax=Leptonychotes weddellii TaxID=9713 RepID=A0A7F8RPS6_LEPWE|nr:ADP-ribosylation factor-related protein 1 isoform X3 [Leptonychotes weddellii]
MSSAWPRVMLPWGRGSLLCPQSCSRSAPHVQFLLLSPLPGHHLTTRLPGPGHRGCEYYAECHGVIYVIDSTDEERLSESKRAFEKMVTSEALDGVPILVLANKQDVETCLSIPDIKTAFSDCTSKIGRRDCLTQACSALTGKGVREGIEWMVKCVVRNVHRPPRQRDIT